MKSVFFLLVFLVSVVAGTDDRGAPDQKKTAEVGGVTVSVTPLNLTASGSATLDFQITMDTHAGALPSDMLKVAKLVGEKGAETLPLAWSGGRGGHHLSGRLSFPAVGSESEGAFTLFLKGVGGRNDMRFEWKVHSKFVSNSTGGAR
jgi:hypothetical protein